MSIDPQLNKIIDGLYRVSAKALILDHKKLLVTQELDDEWWSLPGGGIDYGEEVSSALKRGIEEELGISQDEVKVSDKILFDSIGEIVDGIPRVNLYYKASIPMKKIKKTKEIIDFKWVNSNELSKLYLSPSVVKSLNDLNSII